MKVNLLLEELALNVQGYGEIDGQRFDVEINSNASQLSANFSDNGTPFDPTTDAPAPDIFSAWTTAQLDGLGVHLVRPLRISSTTVTRTAATCCSWDCWFRRRRSGRVAVFSASGT